MKKRITSDEIDFIELIINFWNNKLKITVITFCFVILSAILYSQTKPPITAKTEIIPISIFEDDLYSLYNSLNNSLIPPQSENEKNLTQQRFDNIDRSYLFNLFLAELQIKEVVEKAIKDYQLIDQKKYENESEYLEAVEKKALKLKVLRPIIPKDANKKDETRLNWTIEFKINDKEKWEQSLSFIDNEINNRIKNYLKINFKTTLNNLKLLNQFKLEDLNNRINNVRKDYNTETDNRLAFLREQALIARKLNIENNTLEVENFTTPSAVISNLQTGKPYYMRGYSMIEKEIELIETRTNQDAFTNNLFELEKQKRDLLENKSLERIEKLFNTSPIFSSNEFKAAKIMYNDTNYESSSSLMKVILISAIFGITFGMIYVLVSNAIQQRQ